MGVLSLASGKSRWRGYEYYMDKRVSDLKWVGDTKLYAMVKGSRSEPYSVMVDLEHVRSSDCDCPHAAGRRIVCKHMVAAFFEAFPEEAVKFYDDVQKAQREWEDYQAELPDRVEKYVRRLKRKEAQDLLLMVLELCPEWLWESFVSDYVEAPDEDRDDPGEWLD